MVNFEENYHFSRFQRGSIIFNGVQLFQGGGGSNCLFPIETHITCDFPGVVQTPCPPSGPALAKIVIKFSIAVLTLSRDIHSDIKGYEYANNYESNLITTLREILHGPKSSRFCCIDDWVFNLKR